MNWSFFFLQFFNFQFYKQDVPNNCDGARCQIFQVQCIRDFFLVPRGALSLFHFYNFLRWIWCHYLVRFPRGSWHVVDTILTSRLNCKIVIFWYYVYKTVNREWYCLHRDYDTVRIYSHLCMLCWVTRTDTRMYTHLFTHVYRKYFGQHKLNSFIGTFGCWGIRFRKVEVRVSFENSIWYAKSSVMLDSECDLNSSNLIEHFVLFSFNITTPLKRLQCHSYIWWVFVFVYTSVDFKFHITSHNSRRTRTFLHLFLALSLSCRS